MATGIQWTDETWNPVVGCAPVSPGCVNCYAARMSLRLERMKKKGYLPKDGVRIAEVRGERPVFTGSVRLMRSRLDEPLAWKSPRRIFVNSMSDLFYGDAHDEAYCRRHGVPFEPVPFEFIAEVFTTMGQASRHTFQVLTKRPGRMLDFYRWNYPPDKIDPESAREDWLGSWPNVWLGISAEDQKRLDERWATFRQVPAAVRFISYEPALGPLDVSACMPMQACNRCNGMWPGKDPRCPACSHFDPMALATHERPGVDWIIAGGESGPHSREHDLAWSDHVRRQCQEAGVAFFQKQLGRRPVANGCEITLRDQHGGDDAEWPEPMRLREFPTSLGPPRGRPLESHVGVGVDGHRRERPRVAGDAGGRCPASGPNAPLLGDDVDVRGAAAHPRDLAPGLVGREDMDLTVQRPALHQDPLGHSPPHAGSVAGKAVPP